MLERHTFQKLHSDEGVAVLFTDVVDRADIGMIEGRSGLGLPLKAGQRLVIFGNIVGQKLQGDESI